MVAVNSKVRIIVTRLVVIARGGLLIFFSVRAARQLYKTKLVVSVVEQAFQPLLFTRKIMRKRIPLDEGVLKMATSDVIAGKGLRWTADFYGINHTTLYYRVQTERKRRELMEKIIGEGCFCRDC